MNTPFGRLNLTGILMLLAVGAIVVTAVGASSGNNEAVGFGVTFLFILSIPLGIAIWWKMRRRGGSIAPRGSLARARMEQQQAIHSAQNEVQQQVDQARAEAQDVARQTIAKIQQVMKQMNGQWV